MSGGYTMVEIDLAEALAGDRRLRIEDGRAGLAAVFRDEGALVGFRMLPRRKVPAQGIPAQDLVDDAVRETALCARLCRRFRPEGLKPRRLSIAICTKDRPDWLARLLASLIPLRAEVPFEILVVDNASSDDATRRIAEATAGVRYLHEPCAGLDFARNRAVREATGDVLAFLDDDVVVDPGWARALARVWAENPDAGAVTGLVMPIALDTRAQVLFELRGGFRRGFRPLRYGATVAGDRMHPAGAGQFGAGANMSFDLELVRRLGGFDEALDTGRPLPGGGDLDMFYRVLRAGRPLVYEPGAAVFHDHRRDLAVLRRQYYTWGLGFAAFLVKSMRTDPDMRPAHRRMVVWWFWFQAKRFPRRLIGREPTPVAMIVAEIVGGVRGFLGEYDRSVQRSAAIRERSA